MIIINRYFLLGFATCRPVVLSVARGGLFDSLESLETGRTIPTKCTIDEKSSTWLKRLSPIFAHEPFTKNSLYYIKQNIYIEDNYSKIITKSGKRNAVGIFPTLEIQTEEVKEI
jgi:hypothetical protein